MKLRNASVLLVLIGLFACQQELGGEILVSVDFKDGMPVYSGVESWAQTANPVFGAANVWNGLPVPHLPAYPGQAVSPYTNLVSSSGSATGISFEFLDPVSAYSASTDTHAPNLLSDFVLLDTRYTGTILSWRITGLLPNTTAYMYLYSTNNVDAGVRSFTMVVQGTNYFVDGNTGAYVGGIHVDASGTITGAMLLDNIQPSWAGFQIAEDTPEPSTLLLLPAGALLVVLRRRFL